MATATSPPGDPAIASAEPHIVRLAYRADIEGLRALAVMLVVASHAGTATLAGGYIGVDVFFVLSGFLISGLLVTEIERNGRLDFAGFYARRLQRLLPALATMLLVSAFAAMLLLSPLEQNPLASAARSAALWLSNFHFWTADISYFDDRQRDNIFLHTWSLGVEEQFYLLWPALVAGLAGVFSHARIDHRRLQHGLLVVALACLAGALLLTWRAPKSAFYLMPARGWQFALGALVYLWHRDGAPAAWVRWYPLLGWIGLVALVAAACLFDGDFRYPGGWALVPTVATCLLLASGSGPTAGSPWRLLTLPPMHALGRVSYAWYLWHWPVFVLGATLLTPSLQTTAALVGVSLALAALSHAAIESPLRRSRRLIAHPVRTIVGALVVMGLLAVGATAWQQQVRGWIERPEQAKYLEVLLDSPEIYRLGCDDWYRSAQLRACRFGPADAVRHVVVIGDSVGLQWFSALQHVFAAPDWRITVFTKSSCPIVDEPVHLEALGRPFTECDEWRRALVRHLGEVRPDMLVVGSSATYPFDAAQWVDGSRRVLRPLAAAADRTVVLAPTPLLPFNGPFCLMRNGWRGERLGLEQPCSAPLPPGAGVVQRHLEQAIVGIDRIAVVGMNDLVCPDGWCAAQSGDIVVYRDQQHLSRAFVDRAAPRLAERLLQTE